MLVEEIVSAIIEKRIWAKSGNKVVRKYRCTSGIRKNRIVSNIGQCFAAPNVQDRKRLKITRARLVSRMSLNYLRSISTYKDQKQAPPTFRPYLYQCILRIESPHLDIF